MAREIPSETTKPPAERGVAATYFYPSEVVQILALDGIDYAQLRRFFKIVRGDDSPRKREWARFTFEDLVAVRVAIKLAGGTAALSRDRRLQIIELERACESLRALGIPKPLTQVRLRLVGSSIIATLDGADFRPATQQLALFETEQLANRYLADVVQLEAVRAGLRKEIASTKRSIEQGATTPRRLRASGGALRW